MGIVLDITIVKRSFKKRYFKFLVTEQNIADS